ncbi:MAG TPA: SDR family oxidoreductase [Polyangiaceae bacterium]|jgi:putative NADH-flavin reductase|nr:SDR family oxidoreductase [Polyangiaceae bacterium]
MASAQRIFLLGATGRTGLPFLEMAEQRGHRVTAFVRSPAKLPSLPNLTVRVGDPLRVEELRAAIGGHDVVVTTLGHPDLRPSTLLGDAAKSTVAAMQTAGLRRLLVVSAAMLFDDAGLIAAILRRSLLRHVARDSMEMERAVMSADLDWTVVRPPRLTEGPLTRSYLVADGTIPKKGAFVTSRADVAHFLLDEVEQSAHLRRIVGMSTRK